MPGHDHGLDDGHPFCFKKHVLGAAEADSLRPVFPGPLCVSGVVGIGPNPELADFIRPAQQFDQPAVFDIGHDRRKLPQVDFTQGSIEGDPIAFFDDVAADLHFSCNQVEFQFTDSDHRGLAELTCDQGCVAGAASFAGEDPLCGKHAVHVVGFGFRTDHDHLLLFLLRPAFCGIGIERDHPHCRPGRDIQAGGDLFCVFDCS